MKTENLEQAKKILRFKKKISIPYLQRKIKISFQEAKEICDSLKM